MRFRPEPSHEHGTPSRTAVLLVNLGTPEAPTAAALRPYLRQFLSDPRVVEIPGPLWWLILNLFILPLRPARSAQKYAAIWTPEGSPLKHHTERQTALLGEALAARGHRLEVVHAMRYGSPSIEAVLEHLKNRNCDRVLILPLYPQYSGTTTASVWDVVFSWYRRARNVPELRLVRGFHDHGAYISALRESVERHWDAHGRGDKLLMSFHGVPRRTLTLGDPYHCECHKTARLLAESLGLGEDEYAVSFQSRFGKAEWLQPYTAATVRTLAQQGVRRLDVICPGFVADCLETLEEIAIEARGEFLTAGGAEFRFIPCLNEAPAWIDGLVELCEQQLSGWSTRPDPVGAERRQLELVRSRERALTMGAER